MSDLFTGQNIQFSYNSNGITVPILSGTSFIIPQQSFSCLVGPSGTGKTTLLNLLGLVEPVPSGSLRFLGADVHNIKESKKESYRLKDIGFVFQSFYLLPTLTVRENAAYFLPLLGLSSKEASQRLEHYLSALGLGDLGERYPAQLSGGQRQRVAIARALVKKPKVILADEPTANLDSQTAESIVQVFKTLQKEDGVSFFFSTHDQRLIKYADQMYTIEAGKMVSKAVHA